MSLAKKISKGEIFTRGKQSKHYEPKPVVENIESYLKSVLAGENCRAGQQ